MLSNYTLVFLLASVAAFGQSSRFVPITPCRAVDTRLAAAPRLSAGTTRSFNLAASNCGIPTTATAYSLNVTVVPTGPLAYLTIWPTGQTQPLVSTLNSFEGRVVANAALVPAGTGGSVSVFVTNDTEVILDVNGYFDGQSSVALPFFTLSPCRLVDTRNPAGDFGGPSLAASTARAFPLASSPCGLPSSARAYSLNATVVPQGPLAFLTLWPTGQVQPPVSTLNAFDGRVVANAALSPASANGSVSAFASNPTDLILDVNGYFASSATGTALSFFPVTPCRIADTRNENGAFGGPRISGGGSRSFRVPDSACGIPTTARAYSVNVTAVPPGPMQFLTLWPTDQNRPLVSTLNSFQGSIVANAAIVPAAADGSISVFASDASDVILDINGYFASTNPQPDFTLTVSPGTRSVTAGGAASYTATVTSLNGFNSAVTLSAAAPAVTATFSPVTVTPPANGTATSTLTLQAGNTAGSFTATVNATAGATVRSQQVALTVTAAPTAPAQITINNFSFSPTPVTISAGGQVTWTNVQAGVTHNVVADGGQFSSPLLQTGNSFSTAPATPGTYTYHCTIHPFMNGSVVVQ